MHRSFIFDDEAFEIKRNGEETDNIVVGGRNRWPYSSFINWEMYWPGFPVLVYFKVGAQCEAPMNFCCVRQIQMHGNARELHGALVCSPGSGFIQLPCPSA